MPTLPSKTQIALTFGSNDAHAPQAATMTSLEIESVTGSRHDNVKRTIETLAAKGVISLPQTEGVKVQRERRTETVEAYLFTGDKGRRDSIIVVAQLCPEFTARIVDRWQELEAQAAAPAFAVPTTFSQALMLAAQQAAQIEQQQAALALAAPKVAFVDQYVDATGLKGFRKVAKALKANEARFREFLIDNKIMYRLNGDLMPYANHQDAGRFEVKTGEKNGHAFNRAYFTPKGLMWVTGEWAKHQLCSEVAV